MYSMASMRLLYGKPVLDTISCKRGCDMFNVEDDAFSESLIA